MKYHISIADEIQVPPEQVAATIELLDADNTIPFIARYRKEVTGGLDEEQIRRIKDALDMRRALDERRETVLRSIQQQGKLTPELSQKILNAGSRTELEDLYQPYKPKRKTRASVAREKGLQGLADLILQQARLEKTISEIAAAFLSDEVPTVEEALAGGRDIVAETISDRAEIRQQVREKALQWGSLHVQKIEQAEDPRNVYQLYYEFSSRVERMRPHQALAINRGEQEKILRVRVEIAERDWRSVILAHFRPDHRSVFADHLLLAINDSAERLLLPAIERDVRRALTERAETHAIKVFASNLRALLGQPPITGHVVMGIDPGYRTGCKIAVVDATGRVLATTSIYPHQPHNQWDGSKKTLTELILHHRVTLIAIGNGTASRETEQLVAELTRLDRTVNYLIVNEAGASVYSASPLARAELPGLDISLRGAVSIARRMQDPLAELVKIEPKSIGVGMYQHDVDQKILEETLTGVVESVVNQVGVELNSASPALLSYVAGIGPKLADRIVAHRDEHGAFSKRGRLLDVPGLGPKAYEQSAGFLRIWDGDNPLDASAIHPESYAIAEAVLRRAGISIHTPPEKRKPALDDLLISNPVHELAEELSTGIPTLEDILEQLVRPGRDPRQDLPRPILRSDVLSMEDLREGMRLQGTVRNLVDFGAFIDIGVKQDGLLHRSQIPREAILKVGDVIEVRIQKVEVERGRISLGWPGETV
jgi:uncharacterized protein